MLATISPLSVNLVIDALRIQMLPPMIHAQNPAIKLLIMSAKIQAMSNQLSGGIIGGVSLKIKLKSMSILIGNLKM